MASGMMQTPRVSIVLPAYNEAGTISRVVRAALAHTPAPCEVVVIDDGSIDETARLAEEAGARVVRLHRNQGKGVAMRAALDTPGKLTQCYVFGYMRPYIQELAAVFRLQAGGKNVPQL
ncbi:MAG: glycosyltransferase, partial [Deltaproteobacteria bacterium]